MKKQSLFTRFAKWASHAAGRPVAFMLAAGIIVIWALSGPLFKFGDTWQLVINTSTTIVTFLMVFLIQNTQNRDSQALQIKLDDLIRTQRGARLELMDLEELDQEYLDELRDAYERLAQEARIKQGQRDDAGRGIDLDDTPEIHLPRVEVDEHLAWRLPSCR